jgi:diguanylate cyclase (GGDEF)-like protein
MQRVMSGSPRSRLPAKAVTLLATLLALSLALLLAGTAFGLMAVQPAGADQAGRQAWAAAMLGAAVLFGLLAFGLGRRRSRLPAAAPSRDPLTGLPSGAGFHERLEGTLVLGRRQGWHSALLVLDLRDFQSVNEQHGRAAGDEVLRMVARRLRAAVRREDVVARLAANRFAVVQTALLDLAGALQLAERLAATLAEPLPGTGAGCTADIGIAIAPEDADEAGLLLDRAEDALTAARAAPHPTIHCFAPAQEAALRERRRLEQDLRAALEAGDFLLHWQPQRRLADRRLTGFEALLRWPHAERGMIPPDRFIPLAEATGLIVPLGPWVIRTAVQEAASWPDGLRCAVNLSVAQLRADGLVATIAEALAASGLPPQRLELEVTESLLLQEDQHSQRVLAELQALGVSVALDDFGRGWSSLVYLRRFPFDQIKLDRGFLRELEPDPRVAAVVSAILALGHGLGMRVVAEGIETEDQAQRLLALGCEHGQGWHLGRPMPAAEVRALIASETAGRTFSAA